MAQFPTLSAAQISSVFAVRYLSAVGVSAFLYDHLLTSVDEVRLVWFNPQAGWANKMAFALNRYITEGMVVYLAYMFSGGSSGLNDGDCRRFIWVFAVATSAMVAIFHFVIIARVYALWDRRARIKWILLVAFGIEISTTAVFTVLAAEEVKSFIKYDDFATHMCVLEKKPWALPFAVGALPVFDLFVIFMTVCNALDRPHRKQADIVTALIHDGVRMFLFNFVLSAVNFAMIIAGTTANFFATMPVVLMLASTLNSRMQLRFESLRFSRFTGLPEGIELSEIS